MAKDKPCTEICYQQWVDMFNKKDKECFDLQLQIGKLQHDIEVFTRQLEKANKEVCQEKEKNAILRQKLEQQEQECEELKNLFQNPEVRVALTDIRTGERDIWRKLGNKAQKYEQALNEIKAECTYYLMNAPQSSNMGLNSILSIIDKAKGIK